MPWNPIFIFNITIFDCTNFDLPDEIYRAFRKWQHSATPNKKWKKINSKNEKRPTNSSFPNGLSSSHFFSTPSHSLPVSVHFLFLRISQSVEMNAVDSIHFLCVQTKMCGKNKNGKRADVLHWQTFSRWLEKWQMLIVSIRMKIPLWNHAIWLFADIITYRKNRISADIIQLIPPFLLFSIVNLFTRTTTVTIITTTKRAVNNLFIRFHQLLLGL